MKKFFITVCTAILLLAIFPHTLEAATMNEPPIYERRSFNVEGKGNA